MITATPTSPFSNSPQLATSFGPAKSAMAAAPRPVNRPDSIEGLVEELAIAVQSAVGEIRLVNNSTRILSLNARIEAARAGRHGAAFGVVASEMQNLSGRITEVANHLASTTHGKISDLLSLIGNNIRGTRLSDLALTNIDLIDRCLYERTCDVRWWATDSSLTDALQSQTPTALEFASRRMSIILDAYTVYYDLVLCDLQGRVVAHGRPDRFESIGQNVSCSPWFSSAIATCSGDQFGFQSAHLSELVERQQALVYSCTVREGGQSRGKAIGVLGVVFNWGSLAASIMQNLPITAQERKHTECMIVDANGLILASHLGSEQNAILNLPEFSRLQSESKGYLTANYQGKPCCVAFAKAPGFETYSTDWYSLIIQPCRM